MTRLGLLVLALLAGGCASQQSDLEFRLKKAEADRDQYRAQVEREQGRVAALQRLVETEQDQWNAARAEVSLLNERVARLTQQNKELAELVEQLKSRPATRPASPASPLPPDLDAALQEFARKFPERVWYDRGKGAISFANDRLFDPGSDVVKPEAAATLTELAGLLARAPAAEFEIIVVGHTDDSPITREETRARHPTNWHLSVHRAIGVRDVLDQAGLPAERLAVMGYAEYRPLGGDRARNRRVEIFVARKGVPQPLTPVMAGGR